MSNYRMEIEFVDDSDNAKTVLDGLIAFNAEKVGYIDIRPLGVYLRDEKDNIMGGLVGKICWNWLYIDRFWIKAPARGKGLGRKLLALAEKEAVTRGCSYAFLDTFDFQARGFYEKQGYEIFGVLDDFPDGHERYFMKKEL